MLPVVKKYAEVHLQSLPAAASILEIGSYDVNGRIARQGLYIGVDMRPGPNVDIVTDAAHLPFPDAAFDCVLCLETLEHCEDPFAIIREARRVLRPEGLFILSVPGIYFGKHEYPKDYWRFTTEGVGVLLRDFHDVNIVETAADKNIRARARR